MARHMILSMMKDEGPWLLEWLAYHRLIGFDTVCVFTNDCSDGTDAMLGRLEAMGLARHFRNEVPEGKRPQPSALRLARDLPETLGADWAIVLDADEFVQVNTGGGTLDAMLSALPAGTDAIALLWRVYGSSGHETWNPGPVLESYPRAAPMPFPRASGVKTLFRPFANMRLGIHRPHLRNPGADPQALAEFLSQSWVDGNGEALPAEFLRDGWRLSGARAAATVLGQINHYAVRSREAYLLRRARGNVNLKEGKYDAAYFAIHDRNEQDGRGAAHARSGEVSALVAEWLEDPELNRLHGKALRWHEAQLERLRADPRYPDWMEELAHAAETPLEALQGVLFTKHLPPFYQQVVAELQAQGVPDETIAALIGVPEGTTSGPRAEIAERASPEDVARAILAGLRKRGGG